MSIRIGAPPERTLAAPDTLTEGTAPDQATAAREDAPPDKKGSDAVTPEAHPAEASAAPGTTQ